MEKIIVQAIVNEPVEKVWDIFTKPEHITKWNRASQDWHCPRAENDLRAGGRFTYRMEAKDGSEGFDFSGVYDDVVPQKKIAYTMDDSRKAEVLFEEMGNSTAITVVFDPESENPVELQKAGWQAILDSFKRYAETN
jgi:uncharacterized protein YndB with AHSA1/START domain